MIFILITVGVLGIVFGVLSKDYAYAMLSVGFLLMGIAWHDARQDYEQLQVECDYQGVGEY